MNSSNDPKHEQPTPEELALRRLQTETMLGFSRVHQRILQRATNLLDAQAIQSLTPARANALIVLFNARRPIKASELSAELAISEVTVSRFIRKMQDDGWVQRTPDPDDRRAMLIAPTKQARDLFPRLVKVSNQVLDDIFGDFSKEGLKRLASQLSEIQDNLTELDDVT